jgi:integrase
LIEAIKNPSYKIVAQIQFESGSRISECTHLNINNLRGLKKDPITGQEKGVFLSNRLMGGKSEEKYIFTETYKKLEEQIAKATEGRFIVKDYTYRNSLKTASKKTNQDYNGTEGLILNFKVRRNIEISKFYDNLKR